MAPKLEKTRTPGVYKRGARYVVRYRYRGQERKRFARTYEEARDLKADLHADIRRGDYRELGKVTFESFVEGWLEGCAASVRPSTLDGYKWSLQQKAVPFFRKRVANLTEIEPQDVRAYVAWLQDAKAQKRKRPLSANTVRNHLTVLKTMLSSAAADGVLRYSPAAYVRAPGSSKADHRRVRAMDTDELVALLAAVDPGWRPFFELLAATGCRIGEQLELRWKDVDLGAKRLTVARQVLKTGRIGPPKSGTREIPLSTMMCRRLWRLQGAADELLFTGPRGLHVDRRWLTRKVLDPAAKKAGVPWVSPHIFRHTCASTLFASGKSVKQVQGWLGHADPAFTLRTYIHLVDDGLGSADFLDEAKWATGGPQEPRERGQTATPATAAESAG